MELSTQDLATFHPAYWMQSQLGAVKIVLYGEAPHQGQGFWYSARSRTREIQVFLRNPAKFPKKTRNTAKSARNISKYMSAKHI